MTRKPPRNKPGKLTEYLKWIDLQKQRERLRQLHDDIMRRIKDGTLFSGISDDDAED